MALYCDYEGTAYVVDEPELIAERTITPIPLGLGRLAYLELPIGWQKKELKKLVKIIELALQGDAESSRPCEENNLDVQTDSW